MNQKLLVIYLLLSSVTMFSQQDAWVYLSDKENVEASIANPISILSQEALDRKSDHNISIDYRDVPVNENYITQLKAQSGIEVLAKSKWLNCVHVRGSQTDIDNLQSLSFITDIDFADSSLNNRPVESFDKFEVETVMTDFNYGNSANQIEMFNGQILHDADFTGQGMTIVVIDAGFPNVDTMNGFQRLRDNGGILGGYDFFDRNENFYANTSSSHGTMVLSDMAGYVENQFVGTAPDAQYYLFRTENAPNENPVEESLWVEALERADSLGVDLVNSSLGYKDFYDNASYNYSDEDMDGQTAFITRGANIGFEKGLLIVSSAGNSGSSGVGAPADSPNVFSIGAVNASGDYASFSSQGSEIQPTIKPDVSVQGQSAYVINASDNIVTASGTSFSSPILAGGIACLWQALPELNPTEIMQLVRESASQYDTPDYLLGYGIPDLGWALNEGLSTNDLQQNDLVKVYPNPVNRYLHINYLSDTSSVKLNIFDILGNKINKSDLSFPQTQIDLAHLKSGIYLLKIESGRQSQTLKLIKK